MTISERYMHRALELAARGAGLTSPNPMVGAVIVAPDGRIIGEGWHRRCGEGHAEVNAVASVRDRAALRDCTMYVTLEPCSHWGKTPPCAKLIIDSHIPRVVVAADDPFREVAGRGIRMLRDAGVEVVTGVLADESRRLNARFMTAHEQRRPWVTLKWAQSRDGYMDSDRPDGHPEHFSNPITAMLTHRLRSLHDAILVGSGTAVADAPRLDCRLWPGRSPQPLVADRRGTLNPADIATPLPPRIMREASVADMLVALYRDGITSVLIEGGPTLLQAFIDSNLWDAARVETTPTPLGTRGRAKSPTLAGPPAATRLIDNNRLDWYSNNPLFSTMLLS